VPGSCTDGSAWALATLAALAAGVRVRGGVDPRVYMRWLRRFLWAMAVLLVFQFFRSLSAPE